MRHPIVRDGVLAGVIGATGVALWFFVADLLLRSAFYTPIALGRALITLLGSGPAPGPVELVIIYTIVHYVAFIAVGLLASVIVHVAEREPSVLAGGLILFVAIEIGFYGWSAILAHTGGFGTVSWIEVTIGNLVAAVTMGFYLWRANPGLRHELRVALDGTER